MQKSSVISWQEDVHLSPLRQLKMSIMLPPVFVGMLATHAGIWKERLKFRRSLHAERVAKTNWFKILRSWWSFDAICCLGPQLGRLCCGIFCTRQCLPEKNAGESGGRHATLFGLDQVQCFFLCCNMSQCHWNDKAFLMSACREMPFSHRWSCGYWGGRFRPTPNWVVGWTHLNDPVYRTDMGRAWLKIIWNS